MKLELLERSQWEEHCTRCSRGSIYQDPRWLRLIESVYPKLRVVRLGCSDSTGNLRWLLPLVEIRPLFRRAPMLISVPFGNYGGFLLPPGRSQGVDAADVAPLKEFFGRSGAFALELRETGEPRHDLQQETGFVYYELEVPEDLESFSKRTLTGNTRNMIRKGEKLGIEAVFDDDHALREFQRINELSMAHFGTPTHHVRWYRTIAALFEDEAEIVLGRYQGEFVGALFFLREHGRAVLHAALTHPDSLKLPVQDQLLWAYVQRRVAKDGPLEIDFGRTRAVSGKRFFKRRWGAVEHPLVYSYLLQPGAKLPQILPENRRFTPAIRAWRLLPRPVQRTLGPLIRVRIPT